MINLVGLLQELNSQDLFSYLDKWTKKRMYSSFPKVIFTELKKRYPNATKFGTIYRIIDIPIETIQQLGAISKLNKFIYDKGLKSGYSSYSTTKRGILNFNDILGFDSDIRGNTTNGNSSIVISQKSEYLELQLFKKVISHDAYEIIKSTNEVIAIIDKQFKIDGEFIYPNKIKSINSLYTDTGKEPKKFSEIHDLVANFAGIVFPEFPEKYAKSIDWQNDLTWRKFENSLYHVGDLSNKTNTIDDLRREFLSLITRHRVNVAIKDAENWFDHKFDMK